MIAAATPTFALPSLPDPLTGLHALVAVGCAAIGVVLVLRGLRLSRWLMMAAGAVAGLILAGPLSARMSDIPTPVVRLVLAGSLAIIAFITARLWIGLLASVLAGSITVAWMLSAGHEQLIPPDMPALALPDTSDLIVWTGKFYCLGGAYLAALAKAQLWLPLVLVALAVLIPLVFTVVARKLTIIVVTSVVGSAIVLVGAVTVAAYAKSVSDAERAVFGRGGLIAIGCIAAVGVTVQIITTYVRRRNVPAARPAEKNG